VKLQLRFCCVEWTREGARVTFPGGCDTQAWPHPEVHHYHVIAHRLGYGDDLLAYAREHELAHAVVAEELMDAPSYVLRMLSRGGVVDPKAAVIEEIAAQTLQRWVRANERPIVADCDWDAMKARFLRYVEQLEDV
jgi:hypothetical protein